MNDRSGQLICTIFAFLLAGCAVESVFRPIDESLPPSFLFSDISLTSPSGRDIPVRTFRPGTDCSPCDLIIFSHGAFAAYDRYDVLLTEWASEGYVVAAPQHVDSEDYPDRASYGQAEALPLRIQDYAALSEYFSAQSGAKNGLTFSGRQFAVGHSFGGLIALIAGGADLEDTSSRISETSVKPLAVVAISPPGEMGGLIDMAGYSAVDVPLLVITGTTDTLSGFIENWQTHLDSFEANRDSGSRALVFDKMNHYFNGAFGRIAPEGLASKDAIDTLNARIVSFLKATADGESLSGPDWDQTDPHIVRTLG